MNKNLLKSFLVIMLLTNCAYAGFKEHYDLGQEYFSSFQYSSAITEFKNALRINYMDNSARVGLINAYIARATYSANAEKNYEKAADDYRSALFYMQYYPEKILSTQYIPQLTGNLNACLKYIKFDMSPANRYNTAKQLRAEGNFSAAGYEFNQTLGGKEFQKDSFEQVGDIMKLLGNNSKAAEYYRKAVNVSPTDLDLRLSYAKMLDLTGHEDAAVNEYNYILARTTDNKELLYSLERIYKRKLEKSPSDAYITSNLGAILQKQEKYDDALMYYQKAEYLDPSNTNTRLNVGTLYQQKGDYKTAIKAYDSILIADPNNINANLYKAQSQEALGNTKEAIDGYKKVLALDPANTQAQANLLTAVKGSMTTTQFVDYVKRNMSASNPSEILYNYALDLHKQNKLADAINMYKEAIKLNAQNPEMYVNLAIAQNQSNTPETALNTLKSALVKFPDNSQLKDALASINGDIVNTKLEKAANLYDSKDYKKAIEEYSSIQPPTLDSLLGIASSYQALEDNKQAIVYYEKAFKLKPTDSDIAYYIAVLYGEENDFETARSYLNKSLAINKNNDKAMEFMKSVMEQINSTNLNKAIELYEANKYDEALPLLNDLLAKDKTNSYAFYYRGMVYDAQNKKNEAINDFIKAYELNKDFEIVNYLIGVDYDSLGKYKEAYTYFSKYSNSNAEDDEYKQYAKARSEELKGYAK